MSDSRTQGQPVIVTIYGQEYPIRGRSDEAHIREVAKYVDDRMAMIGEATTSATPARLAILAALNIADELLTLKKEKERIVSEVEEKAKELSEYLNQGIREG